MDDKYAALKYPDNSFGLSKLKSQKTNSIVEPSKQNYEAKQWRNMFQTRMCIVGTMQCRNTPINTRCISCHITQRTHSYGD